MDASTSATPNAAYHVAYKYNFECLAMSVWSTRLTSLHQACHFCWISVISREGRRQRSHFTRKMAVKWCTVLMLVTLTRMRIRYESSPLLKWDLFIGWIHNSFHQKSFAKKFQLFTSRSKTNNKTTTKEMVEVVWFGPQLSSP